MKKQQPSQLAERDNHLHHQELELLKAVAQAWHGHSGNPRHTKEFDASLPMSRFKTRGRPTRFKVEAAMAGDSKRRMNWDFSQSLWDSYEIVTVSKKLESSLSLSQMPIKDDQAPVRVKRHRRESKHSLRSLFARVSSSSKRFHDVPLDDGGDGHHQKY
ncbi:hypothetical protein QJS04_geneDACA004305 [Acorus gramineus]|uniref:Uncharacterized protein n=1 Tax=Acorus gramineus TaxID=55184 RepID=A0AAV9B2C8_ACOGR|nr:hypothetical protein QJS04_geneDACA004305 [Acorus gramineus]